jgi:hypothetical protein
MEFPEPVEPWERRICLAVHGLAGAYMRLMTRWLGGDARIDDLDAEVNAARNYGSAKRGSASGSYIKVHRGLGHLFGTIRSGDGSSPRPSRS